MTSTSSTAAFRILAVATFAAVVFLDVSLAHARAAGTVPTRPSADCNAAAPRPAPAAVTEPAAPPGIFAAFGSCGDESSRAATPPIPR